MSDAGSGLDVMVEALRHPVRRQILGHLSGGPSSPSEMARDLRVAIGVVDYHMRQLAEVGAARLVEIRPERGRRGPPRHYYEAEPLSISDEDWLAVPAVVRRAVAVAALREVASMVGGSRAGP